MNAQILNQELIPTFSGQLNGSEVLLTSAKDLHSFLEVTTPFSMWIERRIQEYDLKEGEDYEIVSRASAKDNAGGRPITEYHLTVDTAKELGMVEKTPKGREIRRYFIALEAYLKEMHDAGWLEKFENERLRLNQIYKNALDGRLEPQNRAVSRALRPYQTKEALLLQLCTWYQDHLRDCTCAEGRHAKRQWEKANGRADVSSYFNEEPRTRYPEFDA